jgi:eukaryotic-like serine/threonine-protein kinase
MPTRSDPTLAGWTAPPTERASERLGPWQITGLLHSGPRGEVYEVRRADGQVDGHAALDLLPAGIDGNALLQRLQHDQDALLRLDHPHIARLFDAGLSTDGRPYLVRERVDGQPIDEAARELPLAARLRLFLQLADALACAHRHLLQHGDLTPDQVLVIEPLGGIGSRSRLPGQVKLLGLGITRAMDLPHGEPLGTAADVRGLGLLLYRLITGVAPVSSRSTTEASGSTPAGIPGEPPRWPSSLRADEVNDPQWARTRKRLRGDLDHIVLKALETSPERRYASVDALVQDLQALRSGHPVSARPSRLGYRLRKWAGRHRWAVMSSVIGVAALAGGLGTSLWQLQSAERARGEAVAQAVELKRMAATLVYSQGDTRVRLPDEAATSDEAALTQTVAALEPVLRAAPEDPEMQALAATALGRLAEAQGAGRSTDAARAAAADATLTRALAIGEAVWPRQRSDWRFAQGHVRSLALRAQWLRSAGDAAQALVPLERAIARCDELLAGPPPLAAEPRSRLTAQRAATRLALADTRLNLGQAAQALAQFGLAETELRGLLSAAPVSATAAAAASAATSTPAMSASAPTEALPATVASPVTIPAARAILIQQLADTLGGSALAHAQLDELPAMRQAAEAALALRRDLLAADPARAEWRMGLAADSHTLALALLRLNDPQAALEAAQAAWDSLRTLADGGMTKETGRAITAPQTAYAATLGQALTAVDRHQEALAAYDLALGRWSAELARQNDPALRLRLTRLQVWRARSLALSGDEDTAGPLMSTAIAALRGLASNNGTLAEPLRRAARLALAEALATWAEWLPAEATASRAEAVAALKAAAAVQRLGADHERLQTALTPPT